MRARPATMCADGSCEEFFSADIFLRHKVVVSVILRDHWIWAAGAAATGGGRTVQRSCAGSHSRTDDGSPFGPSCTVAIFSSLACCEPVATARHSTVRKLSRRVVAKRLDGCEHAKLSKNPDLGKFDRPAMDPLPDSVLPRRFLCRRATDGLFSLRVF